jgi:hypothetical protein
MATELLDAIVSWQAFLVALVVFGFAPGALLRLIVLAFHRDDPRRSELLAELHAVPRLERPFWVFEQLEVALFEGAWERVAWAATGRIVDRWHLNSGVKLNRQYPETFWIPDEEAKQDLWPGVAVKLMFVITNVWGQHQWGERMWVDVVAVKRHHLAGILVNHPIGIPRLDPGDRVKFKRDHIIDITWASECLCESWEDHEDHLIVEAYEGCNSDHKLMAEEPEPETPSPLNP